MAGTDRAERLETEAKTTARQAASSPWVGRLARLGLASRGVVYLLIGWLAVQVALGHGNKETDQSGALRAIAAKPYGAVLLWVLALGFAGYALWRFTEAAYGETGGERTAGPRLKSLVRGLVYTGLCVSAVSLALGSGKSASNQQATLSARLMKHPPGRLLVGAIGLGLVVVGGTMVYEGLRKKYMERLQTAQMSHETRQTVEKLGLVGTIARGCVFGLVGVFVVQAAVTFNPDKARGLDGALKSLARATAGPWLLALVALGLIAFGAYSFAEARYRRT